MNSAKMPLTWNSMDCKKVPRKVIKSVVTKAATTPHRTRRDGACAASGAACNAEASNWLYISFMAASISTRCCAASRARTSV